MGRSKEFINNQIIKYYSTTDSTALASRLGITVAHLRVKARRLGVKKIRVNEIIDGKKKCPHCSLMKDLDCFHRDVYQANEYSYYCKTCRAIINKRQLKASGAVDSLAFNKGKKPNEVIVIDDKECLKCKSCEVIQPLTEYSLDNKMSHGHRNTCKSCEMLKRRGLL